MKYTTDYEKELAIHSIEEEVEDSVSYQHGQVLMRNKCLQVIQKYYGSSVYDYLREKIMDIPLEE